MSQLVWFRRDLRLHDHAALYHALAHPGPVHTVFVFDTGLLQGLPVDDARVSFIWHSLQQLDTALRQQGGALLCCTGDPVQEIPRLATQLGVSSVHAAEDYEPAARQRDEAVARALQADGRSLHLHKDQVVFAGREVLTQAGRPYTVFTPYYRAWRARLHAEPVSPWPTLPLTGRLLPHPAPTLPSLAKLGFVPPPAERQLPAGEAAAQAVWQRFQPQLPPYQQQRDFPALEGVSRLSVHLRFGTVSIRQLVHVAAHQDDEGAACWLKELAWREFYQQLLYHFPRVVGEAFKPEYRTLAFPGSAEHFAAWCEGRTGYPLVDAAMRQLNQTGYMHNRLRMLVASFLVKDLLIDWREGEQYFAKQLLDFDLAANNGGWQWAASTGCDAQPWFRIFNPVTQSERFDPQGHFIRRYLPELTGLDAASIHAPWQASPLLLQAAGVRLGQDYPLPIVDHARQREAALALFGREPG
ncbi:cryptochrome/photolyase family protein [Leeia aquatica]|uniref:Deoxyribodipyrimidine photo-lyase n=1 Tax=Leeia aquatica TaxID=2725557 RepID=A0A847SGW8_9NEIS|nr:deoxyribodipyrimidine photo-lyase [Leeia aquatica]NLR76626.1 deoxyribodipyrimidine photo-lyase [Leeia aquatica]